MSRNDTPSGCSAAVFAWRCVCVHVGSAGPVFNARLASLAVMRPGVDEVRLLADLVREPLTPMWLR